MALLLEVPMQFLSPVGHKELRIVFPGQSGLWPPLGGSKSFEKHLQAKVGRASSRILARFRRRREAVVLPESFVTAENYEWPLLSRVPLGHGCRHPKGLQTDPQRKTCPCGTEHPSPLLCVPSFLGFFFKAPTMNSEVFFLCGDRAASGPDTVPALLEWHRECPVGPSPALARRVLR